MNKKLMLAIAAAVVLIAAVVMMKETGDLGIGEKLGTEAALPTYSTESQHVLLKIENVEGLRGGVDFVKSFLPLMTDPDVLDGMSEIYKNMDAFDGADPTDSLRKIATAAKFIGTFDSFLSAADEFSLLVVSNDLWLSFFTTEEKYSALKSGPHGFLSGAEPWTTDLAGKDGEALVLRGELPSFDDDRDSVDTSFYVIKRPYDGKTQVLLSSSEGTMKRASDAWKSDSARAKIERHLDAPNFVQYRFKTPAYTGGTRDFAAEVAWQTKDDVTKIDAYNDLALYGAKPITSGLETEPTPTFGSGDPFALMTVDLPYFFSIAFPGVEDPVGEFLSLTQKAAGYDIPGQFADDVRALLDGSRFSTGVYIKKDETTPKTAYIMVEMKDASVIDKYISLAALLMRPAQIAEWDSAYSVQIDENIEVTLARRGGRVLLGLGAPSEYGVKGAAPAAMSGMPETGVLVSSYIDVNLLTDETTAIGKKIAEVRESDEDFREVFEKFKLDSIDSLVAVQADPERSETRIYWKKK